MSVRFVITAAVTLALMGGALAQNTGSNGGSATSGIGGGSLGSTPPPGTNSAGTAQSSGGGAPGTGTTTGQVGEESIPKSADNPAVDHKVKSICTGC